ncbi:hypothetical protein OB952_20775 [Aeromonas salmonicida]|uniref:hypothetical protein n=1 Tax=Aeromonas salmonicida TaxID=645 RepID=UPI00259D90CC|nr:hypothetical protein [Aeromonas salmonicida]MDM5069773.1 hypothetical protein [Aeromonas salmonicida]
METKGAKQAGKQQRAKQQAKKIPAYAGSSYSNSSISTGLLGGCPVKTKRYIYMVDTSRNQGGVNYQRVIQVRRSLHAVTPELMHGIIKAAGCSTRFAEDGMAFFTYTVGRCEYPLNPCGNYTNKWVGEQCRAQGFTRPADYPAILAGAMLIATEQAARLVFEVAA